MFIDESEEIIDFVEGLRKVRDTTFILIIIPFEGFRWVWRRSWNLGGFYLENY
jgi:hypothetical protein